MTEWSYTVGLTKDEQIRAIALQLAVQSFNLEHEPAPGRERMLSRAESFRKFLRGQQNEESDGAARHFFGARVSDAGGGHVDLIVDRDTMEYPSIGAHVIVWVEDD